MGSLVDPQMRGNLNVRVPRAQAAFVRDGPGENTMLSELKGIILFNFGSSLVLTVARV